MKWRLFAFNRVTNAPVLGDTSNISAKVSRDYGIPAALTAPSVEEIEDGFYYVTLTDAEADGAYLEIYPESSTSDVQVIGVPGFKNITTTTTTSSPETGLAEASQEYGPKRVKTPNMEVEQFDPLTIQRATERANSEIPIFSNFGMTTVTPNKPKYRC